jgi:hypothetical protein
VIQNDFEKRGGGTEMTATTINDRRELAHRTTDGIEVTLLWSKASDRITIAVFDTRSDAALEFDVDGAVALDAFNHPYAYAAALRIDDAIVSRQAADTLTASTDR